MNRGVRKEAILGGTRNLVLRSHEIREVLTVVAKLENPGEKIQRQRVKKCLMKIPGGNNENEIKTLSQ